MIIAGVDVQFHLAAGGQDLVVERFRKLHRHIIVVGAVVQLHRAA